jgi:hypothetical protein
VPVVPLSQLKSTFPVLRTVGRKEAAGFTLEQWRYVFTNTFTEEESRALYERYHIPASVRVLRGSALARSVVGRGGLNAPGSPRTTSGRPEVFRRGVGERLTTAATCGAVSVATVGWRSH